MDGSIEESADQTSFEGPLAVMYGRLWHKIMALGDFTYTGGLPKVRVTLTRRGEFMGYMPGSWLTVERELTDPDGRSYWAMSKTVIVSRSGEAYVDEQLLIDAATLYGIAVSAGAVAGSTRAMLE